MESCVPPGPYRSSPLLFLPILQPCTLKVKGPFSPGTSRPIRSASEGASRREDNSFPCLRSSLIALLLQSLRLSACFIALLPFPHLPPALHVALIFHQRDRAFSFAGKGCSVLVQHEQRGPPRRSSTPQVRTGPPARGTTLHDRFALAGACRQPDQPQVLHSACVLCRSACARMTSDR